MLSHWFKLVFPSGVGVGSHVTGPPLLTQSAPGKTGQVAIGVGLGNGGCGCVQTLPRGVEVRQTAGGLGVGNIT